VLRGSFVERGKKGVFKPPFQKFFGPQFPTPLKGVLVRGKVEKGLMRSPILAG